MTHVAKRWWRPLALGLAAAFLSTGCGIAQTMTFAERLAMCSACHGEDGNSKLENIPSLAGQPAFFVLNQLFLMREAVRKVEAMAPIVKDLKDEDLDALSKHFAGLAPKRSDEKIDPALAKRGEEIATARRCVSCHGPNLGGVDQIPRIAKQRIDFMIKSMTAYRDNPPPGADTAMSANVTGATDADLVALAHYAASK